MLREAFALLPERVRSSPLPTASTFKSSVAAHPTNRMHLSAALCAIGNLGRRIHDRHFRFDLGGRVLDLKRMVPVRRLANAGCMARPDTALQGSLSLKAR